MKETTDAIDGGGIICCCDGIEDMEYLDLELGAIASLFNSDGEDGEKETAVGVELAVAVILRERALGEIGPPDPVGKGSPELNAN